MELPQPYEAGDRAITYGWQKGMAWSAQAEAHENFDDLQRSVWTQLWDLDLVTRDESEQLTRTGGFPVDYGIHDALDLEIELDSREYSYHHDPREGMFVLQDGPLLATLRSEAHMERIQMVLGLRRRPLLQGLRSREYEPRVIKRIRNRAQYEQNLQAIAQHVHPMHNTPLNTNLQPAYFNTNW
jgi:hypothetical protein